jgi:hypothetical protein
LSFKSSTVELEMTMEAVNRVRWVLAETIYDVRQWPTPESQAEIGQLQQRFIALAVALDADRVSSEEAAPQLAALELELLHCRNRLQASRTAVEAAALLRQTARLAAQSVGRSRPKLPT